MRHARLQRDALEAIDRAWAARTITVDRIAALRRQLAAQKETIAIYRKEYEVGRRSLIDLLNAQNQYFDASVSLTSARGVIVFADYQLLAAMGALLEYLKTPPPVEAAPLDTIAFGVLPTRLPPIIIGLPQPGPEPLSAYPAEFGYQPAATFKDRWHWTMAPSPTAALAMAPDVPAQGVLMKEPLDLLALRPGFQQNS